MSVLAISKLSYMNNYTAVLTIYTFCCNTEVTDIIPYYCTTTRDSAVLTMCLNVKTLKFINVMIFIYSYEYSELNRNTNLNKTCSRIVGEIMPS